MAKKKAPEGNVPRLLQFYRETLIPGLTKDIGYKNIMQVPRLEKIVVSVGVSEAVVNKKILDVTAKELGQITGQKAIKTQARKSIANFKIRQGMEIGAKVTLRGVRMYEFLDRLVSVALPRVKDFRGVNPKGFDGRGNYSFGIEEQIIFPEIDFDQIEKVSGMNVAVVTTAKNDDEARQLLKGFGMPFAAR
ncbi:MAG: 50S ribosomal protein L5 [Spirochaetia bacterium]